MKRMMAIVLTGCVAVAGLAGGQEAAVSAFAGKGLDELKAEAQQRKTAISELRGKQNVITKEIEAQADIKGLKDQYEASRKAYRDAYDKSAALEPQRQAVKDAEAALRAASEKAAAECAEAAAPRARLAEIQAKRETLETRAAQLKAGTVEGLTPEQIKAERDTVKTELDTLKASVKEIEKKELEPVLKQSVAANPAVQEARKAVEAARKAMDDAAKADTELAALKATQDTAMKTLADAIKVRQTERAADYQPLKDQEATIGKEIKELEKLIKAAQPAP